jgi:RNA methyltransferase, TrmH family
VPDVIRSAANPRLRWVRQLLADRSARQTAGVFVLEGSRLAEEGLAAGLTPRLVLRTPELDRRALSLVDAFARTGCEILTVTPRLLASSSEIETAPGLLVVADRPALRPPPHLRLAVVADGLADPGNFGSLMRTSLAAGVEAIFLTPGTVDPYNPKVVRGAMGAHFHLPLAPLDDWADSQALSGLELWLAEPGAGVPYHQVDWGHPLALILGNEARGVNPAWRPRAAGSVHIPMRGAAESLNAAVAAAVILFEIARQRGSP